MYNTAKEVWRVLEENLLLATKDREVQLKQQMQDLKLTTQSLLDYLKSFKKMFNGLAAIQRPVNEDDNVIYIYRGLKNDCNAFVTSMLAKPPFPTYSQFVTAMQSFENLGLRACCHRHKLIIT